MNYAPDLNKRQVLFRITLHGVGFYRTKWFREDSSPKIPFAKTLNAKLILTLSSCFNATECFKLEGNNIISPVLTG
jgi:hypothetical protein